LQPLISSLYRPAPFSPRISHLESPSPITPPRIAVLAFDPGESVDKHMVEQQHLAVEETRRLSGLMSLHDAAHIGWRRDGRVSVLPVRSARSGSRRNPTCRPFTRQRGIADASTASHEHNTQWRQPCGDYRARSLDRYCDFRRVTPLRRRSRPFLNPLSTATMPPSCA